MQLFAATVGGNQSVPIHSTRNLIGSCQRLHEKLHSVLRRLGIDLWRCFGVIYIYYHQGGFELILKPPCS